MKPDIMDLFYDQRRIHIIQILRYRFFSDIMKHPRHRKVMAEFFRFSQFFCHLIRQVADPHPVYQLLIQAVL